jgi:hypothetical protein
MTNETPQPNANNRRRSCAKTAEVIEFFGESGALITVGLRVATLLKHVADEASGSATPAARTRLPQSLALRRMFPAQETHLLAWLKVEAEMVPNLAIRSRPSVRDHHQSTEMSVFLAVFGLSTSP